MGRKKLYKDLDAPTRKYINDAVYSETPERCKTCAYRNYMPGQNSNKEGLHAQTCCDYILVEGHMRGCIAGAGCKRYVEKPSDEEKFDKQHRKFSCCTLCNKIHEDCYKTCIHYKRQMQHYKQVIDKKARFCDD